MIAWLLQNMAAASLAMVAVLALRGLVARAFGAGWAYALWLLPLLHLVLPPLPAAIPDLPLPSLAVLIPAAGDQAASLPPQGGPGQWVPVLLALWAGGAAAFLFVQFLAYRAFLTRLSLASRSAGAWRGLPLIESDAVEGPIAVGLLDRRIVVPSDFDTRYGEAERRLAAEHEYVHHRRGDIWWNLIALIVLAMNWFNPIAWFAFLAFRADQELACDAAVASGASAEERHAYASALIKSASRPGLISACPLNHADQLKRRLRMMKHHRHSRLRSLGGAAALALLAGAGLTLAAPGIAQPKSEGETRTEQRRIVIVEGGEGKAGGDHVVRMRRGPNGEVTLPENCRESEPLANVDEQSGNRRTRIMLCERGGANAATRLQRLQQARERIAGDDELTGEHRERVLAALDRAIAQARAAQ
ncbi:MAG TPA: M56 family metallopeptidase [Allosphingosinicella sp.]|nr:M56 family metallopeptidase [Allosphingosinicella sp.]